MSMYFCKTCESIFEFSIICISEDYKYKIGCYCPVCNEQNIKLLEEE